MCDEVRPLPECGVSVCGHRNKGPTGGGATVCPARGLSVWLLTTSPVMTAAMSATTQKHRTDKQSEVKKRFLKPNCGDLLWRTGLKYSNSSHDFKNSPNALSENLNISMSIKEYSVLSVNAGNGFVMGVVSLRVSWNEACNYSNVAAAHLILRRLLFCGKPAEVANAHTFFT